MDDVVFLKVNYEVRQKARNFAVPLANERRNGDLARLVIRRMQQRGRTEVLEGMKIINGARRQTVSTHSSLPGLRCLTSTVSLFPPPPLPQVMANPCHTLRLSA